jgi:hypothetical protein
VGRPGAATAPIKKPTLKFPKSKQPLIKIPVKLISTPTIISGQNEFILAST